MGSESGEGDDGGGGGGNEDEISKMWKRGIRRRSEGMEEERLEEMMRVVLKVREARCLQSSMQGRRWPCPKNGNTIIWADIVAVMDRWYFWNEIDVVGFIEGKEEDDLGEKHARFTGRREFDW